VRAVPLAHIDTDKEIMLVWFRADHPAAPAAATASADGGVGEVKHGDPGMQPQAIVRAATSPAAPAQKPKP
jgi:hypothetical protein